jgi:hypothetical protein
VVPEANTAAATAAASPFGFYDIGFVFVQKLRLVVVFVQEKEEATAGRADIHRGGD